MLLNLYQLANQEQESQPSLNNHVITDYGQLGLESILKQWKLFGSNTQETIPNSFSPEGHPLAHDCVCAQLIQAHEWTCQECGAKFIGNQLEQFNRHLYAMHGIEPFICTVLGCRVKCSSWDNLMLHLIRSHNYQSYGPSQPLLFKCPKCPFHASNPLSMQHHHWMFHQIGSYWTPTIGDWNIWAKRPYASTRVEVLEWMLGGEIKLKPHFELTLKVELLLSTATEEGVVGGKRRKVEDFKGLEHSVKKPEFILRPCNQNIYELFDEILELVQDQDRGTIDPIV